VQSHSLGVRWLNEFKLFILWGHPYITYALRPGDCGWITEILHRNAYREGEGYRQKEGIYEDNREVGICKYDFLGA